MTQDGSFVWFQLGADSHLKITWTLELFLAYIKTSPSDAAARCALFDSGEISELTEQDRRELQAVRPFEKSKIEQERTKYVAAGGGSRDRIGGLPIPEYAKRVSA